MSAVHRRQAHAGLLPEYNRDYDSDSSTASLDEKYHGPSHPPLLYSLSLFARCRLQLRRLHLACKKRAILVACIACIVLTLSVLALSSSVRSARTLVFRREDLQRIWHWEIASGHYPSHREVPDRIGLKENIENPALPPKKVTGYSSLYNGIGPRRHYIDIQNQPQDVAYPARPPPGSSADLDIIMDHCDFSQKKLVRDCLAFLRSGGGLEHGKRPRRHTNHPHDQEVATQKRQYIYTEGYGDSSQPYHAASTTAPLPRKRAIIRSEREGYLMDEPFVKKYNVKWEPPMRLPSPRQPRAGHSSDCDTDNPRLFHMYWTGPFTDKPYLSLLSFLYTQNTGLHNPAEDTACRPKLFMWINPGPAASVVGGSMQELYEQLKSNQWAAPFLHPRFAHIIQFKLWNTAERLDSVPELRDDWRAISNLFNSGGHSLAVPAAVANMTVSPSTSPKEYDRHSVTLSDIARFLLCHHFGGVYLDADTLFLRDWEDLWGWGGAFAYRWSHHDKYNTAVLRLNKRSALGSFIIRTSLKNDFDFHPMSVSKYLREAHLEELLYRLPDALFDSAWLNMEGYQRDVPPHPYFKEFGEFWEPDSAAQALGFDAFFKGAYSYHYHNDWWKAVDPTFNRPDLGPEFDVYASIHTQQEKSAESDATASLSWSTVLKRTFEEYVRGERPNMYGEWLQW